MQVIALDHEVEQLEQAAPAANISYQQVSSLSLVLSRSLHVLLTIHFCFKRSYPAPALAQASAESMGVPSGSVDLVTVAQALHWCVVHQSIYAQLMTRDGALSKSKSANVFEAQLFPAIQLHR